MNLRHYSRVVLTAAGLCCAISLPALAQMAQQGPKLVGSGATGAASQGMAVALSTYGNTAIVGGSSDNGSVGAAWVWTRTGSSWSQQGAKLVGGDRVGGSEQGGAVSLSGDGNTAIVGGALDNTYQGAAWIWTRTAEVWTQSGAKLVGTGAIGQAFQGTSVAMSGDGNTAIVGGNSDNGGVGAAWIWTRNGSAWTQQAKLVGSGAIGASVQGNSVALSDDGNTALVGGYGDNAGRGAAWVWTRNGSTWSEVAKLVGTGGIGSAWKQGGAVALSADGTTAMVGGNGDDADVGATWVWSRSGNAWTQQAKLVASGATGQSRQGYSVSIGADGNSAIIGGIGDNSNQGAAWYWTRNGSVWTQQAKLVGTGPSGSAFQGRAVAMSASGSTTLVGGPADGASTGAAWAYALPGYTITATVGQLGSISPAGYSNVYPGDNLTYTITPDPCCSIGDVTVDGVSIGPVTSYTFTNVQEPHTIHAVFAQNTYSFAASAGAGGFISPSGPATVFCGTNKSYTITADACHHIADVLVDDVSVGAVSNYTFTNVGGPHSIVASFAPNASLAGAVTSLTATQVRTGNDASGTTNVTIAFTLPPGAVGVEVWRKGFGSYPLFDTAPGTGALPSAPASYPPVGWTQTAVTASGQNDHPGTRDYWYYVAYAKDSCGYASPVSNMTTGTLGYHLGDFSNGVTPGQGDNQIGITDVSLLGAHYGASGAALTAFGYLDIGPTSDQSTTGRPTPDSVTDFEDLVIMALNYSPHTSMPALANRTLAPSRPAATNAVRVTAPERVNAGDEFDVPVALSSMGELRAVSVTLDWNRAVVEPVHITSGEMLNAAGGVLMSPGAGRADAAVLGAGSAALTGEGVVALARFRAIAAGTPGVRVSVAEGRDANNHPVELSSGAPHGVPVVVTATDLMPVIPNPARGAASVQYSLAKPGLVDVSIYSVDGRRVRTLVHGTQEVGLYTRAWDGTSDNGSAMRSGVYYVRLQAPAVRKTRVLNLVR